MFIAKEIFTVKLPSDLQNLYNLVPKGSGLAFCPSQQSHTNTLKFHYKDESNIDTSCLQGEIATLPCPFIKRAGLPAM